MPDLQTWDSESVQCRLYAGCAEARRSCKNRSALDVQPLNGKFDEIYERGVFTTSCLTRSGSITATDSFFERHLAHISKRPDVWYVRWDRSTPFVRFAKLRMSAR